MSAIPEPIHSTARAIYAWREAAEAAEPGHRSHLGASIIGHPCDRYLWATFRWVKRARWSGRMLRLFDTGKREEPRVLEELRAIGCEVVDEKDGHQLRVSFAAGHGGGSLDGVIVRGVPEAPGSMHVLEIKTMAPSRFATLQKDGCRQTMPQHWAQMQTYMRLIDIERALYVVVNKATDDLYVERIAYEGDEADRIIARATRLVFEPEPPQRISGKPDWWQCKTCTFAGHCHGTARPEVNCRTCAHATPGPEGRWYCTQFDHESIPAHVVPQGCAAHRYLPALLPWARQVDGNDAENWVEYEYQGVRFRNGARGPRSFPSMELAALDPSLLGDPNIETLRMQCDGEVTQARSA